MGLLDFLGIPKPELQFILIARRDANKTYILPNAPSGWEGALITNARSEQYYAMTRSYSVPIDFVLDGAWILRKEFYVYGMQAIVQLQINQLDKATQLYKRIYLGDCDFSQTSDTKDIFTVNMMDAGIESKIKAYGNTTFEIPIDVPEAIQVELTPIVLTETADLIIVNRNNPQSDTFPGLSIVNNQQVSVNTSVKAVDSYFQTDPDYSTNPSWFFSPTIATEVSIQVDFDIALRAVDGGTYRIDIYKNDGTLFAHLHQYTGDEIVPVNIHQTYTGNLLVGERLLLYFDASTDGTRNDGYYIDGSNSGSMSLSYNTVSPPTTIKALPPYYVYDKLIQLMNGDIQNPYPTASYLLKTTWKQLLITCGDAIRSFDGSVIKISWDDFWQSINAECNASFGDQNGVATLEAKNNAFKRTLPIMNIGEVSGFTLAMYTPYLFNTLKIGYDDQTYDQDNGRLEFNSTQNYKSPITRIQKELDLTSKIRADSYGIEFTRINFSGKETKDAGSDNDTFFIYVKANTEFSGAYQPEKTEGFTSITGAADGMYNFILSPKEMFYRHGNYIHGVMDKLDGDRIFFTSALKDTDLVAVTLEGKRIAEADNVNISSLDPQLFLPYLVTVKCKLPTNALALIDILPNGYVDFTYNDAAYRGFIIESNIDVAKNSTQEFKLLLTPDNDLTQLIN